MEEQLPLFTGATAGDKQAVAFSKYIVYVDESGDHGMVTIDSNYPVFVLSFCVFHKQHYSESVVSSLEKFKFNIKRKASMKLTKAITPTGNPQSICT